MDSLSFRKIFGNGFKYLLVLLMMVVLTACHEMNGEEKATQSSNEESLTFRVIWPNASKQEQWVRFKENGHRASWLSQVFSFPAAAIAATSDCIDIETVTGAIYDASGNPLASVSVACDEGHATLKGNLEGTNRTFVIKGINASSEIVAWYEQYKINIMDGETKDLGTITPSDFLPVNLQTQGADSRATVAWHQLAGATTYNLYWSTMPGVTTASNAIKNLNATTYTHTGLTNNTTYYYILTAADNDGNESLLSHEVSATPQIGQWPVLLGSAEQDDAQAITIDSHNNIYIAGTTDGDIDGNTNAGNSDCVIAKYDVHGNRLWTDLLGSSGEENGLRLATDSADNLYIVGATSGDLDGNDLSKIGLDIFVTKYSAGGDKLWTKLLGITNHSINIGMGISVDSSDHFCVTGIVTNDMSGNFEGTDIVIARYDSDGTELWTQTLGSEGKDYSQGIATDASNNIYIAGHTDGDFGGQANSGKNDILIAKLDPNGTLLWTRLYGTSKYEYGWDITTDTSDNLYITGASSGEPGGVTNAGGYDMLIAKYNADGDQIWINLLGTAETDSSRQVALDSNNNIYVAGYTDGAFNDTTNAGSYDILVAKCDSSGNLLWTRLYGSTSVDKGFGLALDSFDNAYVIGNTYGDIEGLVNSGSQDMFITQVGE